MRSLHGGRQGGTYTAFQPDSPGEEDARYSYNARIDGPGRQSTAGTLLSPWIHCEGGGLCAAGVLSADHILAP